MVDHPSNQIKEHPITAVFHMATGEHDHTAIFNGMGDTVDYIDVNGERFERIRETKMVVAGTPCKGNTDLACGSCGAYNIGEYYDGRSHRAIAKFCPECGAIAMAYSGIMDVELLRNTFLESH